MSGSLARQDQKGPRSHFSKLLPFLFCLHCSPPHSCFLTPGGEGPLPHRAPAAVSPMKTTLGTTPFHKSSWTPPPRPGSPECLSLGSPVNPVLRCKRPPSASLALTVGRGGYCGLGHRGVASVRRPDGVAAITMGADQRAAAALPAQALQLLPGTGGEHEQGREQTTWAAGAGLPHIPGCPGRRGLHTAPPGSR